MKQIKIIPFDLSLVTSDNVYTKDGRKARIICTDRKTNDGLDTVVVLITGDSDAEFVNTYNKDGSYYKDLVSHDLDLVIHQEIDIDLHFEPFQKVLVRHNDKDIWRPAYFSHIGSRQYDDGSSYDVYYILGESRRPYLECIPYDDFKYLCNTAENPTF